MADYSYTYREAGSRRHTHKLRDDGIEVHYERFSDGTQYLQLSGSTARKRIWLDFSSDLAEKIAQHILHHDEIKAQREVEYRRKREERRLWREQRHKRHGSS